MTLTTRGRAVTELCISAPITSPVQYNKLQLGFGFQYEHTERELCIKQFLYSKVFWLSQALHVLNGSPLTDREIDVHLRRLLRAVHNKAKRMHRSIPRIWQITVYIGTSHLLFSFVLPWCFILYCYD